MEVKAALPTLHVEAAGASGGGAASELQGEEGGSSSRRERRRRSSSKSGGGSRTHRAGGGLGRPPAPAMAGAGGTGGTGKQRATESPAAAGASTSSTSAFHRRGQDWFYTTGLPSDVVIEVEDVSFHLHKFPLLSRSARLARLVTEQALEQESGVGGGTKSVLQLQDIPGGPHVFEACAKFCYGVKIELNASNVAAVRCAAEFLEMTEDVVEGNLVAKAESFLDQVVLRSWKESVRALQACQDPSLTPHAEHLGILRKVVDAIATRACSDAGLVGWGEQQHLQPTSPGGSILWNGISTGATRARSNAHGGGEWWYSDLAPLQLPFFQQVIAALQAKGMRPETVAGALVYYAKKHIPGLQRRHSTATTDSGRLLAIAGDGAAGAAVGEGEELDQRDLLEAVEQMLPMQKGLASTRFLFGMLRTAMILNATPLCKSNLERRIGMQLEQATLDDLLLPNYSYSAETLYDVDTLQRILDHFLLLDQPPQQQQQQQEEVQLVRSPSLNPVFIVAKLLDAYLAEVAPDVNLKPAKFQALAEALPDYARLMDDGLYRAVDIYLKAHPWLMEHERERLCRVMDCQKLSLEACTHAAQNERLPLRVVVQVLFFEQLQLRTAIAGCFHVGDNVEQNSRPNPIPGADNSGSLLGAGAGGGAGPGTGAAGPLATVVRENQVLKVDMDKMRARVGDLERECAFMRSEIQKLARSKRSAFKSFDLTKLGCSRQNDSGLDNPDLGTGIEHPPLPRPQRRNSTSIS